MADTTDFTKFLHSVVDKLCVKLDTDQNSVLEQKEGAWLFLLKQWLSGAPPSKQQIQAKLSEPGLFLSLPVEKCVDAVLEVLSARAEDARKSLSALSCMHIAHSSLQDFDWKAQLVLSSDKLSSLSEPTVLVSATIRSNNALSGCALKTHLLELSRSDLLRLLSTCEEISQTVQEFKIY